jgi:hypothetical protein
MGTGRRGIWAGAASVALVAGMLFATPASAGFHYVKHTKSVVSKDLDPSTVKASCPDGTSVLGGGWDGDPGFSFAMPKALQPQGAGGWLASIYVPVESDTTAYAICADNGDVPYLLQTNTDPVKVQPDTRGTATAQCPPGFHVVSGGFAVTRNHMYPAKSYPDAGLTSWTAEADNDSDSPHPLRAYAVCAGGGFGNKLSLYSASSDMSPHGRGPAYVECPAGTKVVGGGGTNAGTRDQMGFGSSYPTDGPDENSRADDAWITSFDNYTNGLLGMTAYAICRKAP